MRKRNCHQNGSVTLDKRDGNWYYRWTDHESGKRKAKKLGEHKTKALAWRAAETYRLEANDELPDVISFRAAAEKYMRDEMPTRFSTSAGYRSWMNNYILPKWGATELRSVKAHAVEQWLKGLKVTRNETADGKPIKVETDMAGKSKANIKGVMACVFDYAMKLEMIETSRNPMELVTVRGIRRQSRPRILTVKEFAALLKAVEREPFKTMLLTDMCLGVRCSELCALKWLDVDWEELTISIRRGIVAGHIDETKTKYSEAPVPMNAALAEVLLTWKRTTEFSKETDWVWASPFTAGEMPYWGWRIQQNILAPAAVKAGLGEGLGWHTLRHTYRSWLDHTGASMGEMMELMRHASIQTTMNVYGGAMSEGKRKANDKVVRMAIR